jgi:hypothetical protein
MNLTPHLKRITLLTALVFVPGTTTALPITARAATAAEIDLIDLLMTF